MLRISKNNIDRIISESVSNIILEIENNKVQNYTNQLIGTWNIIGTKQYFCFKQGGSGLFWNEADDVYPADIEQNGNGTFSWNIEGSILNLLFSSKVPKRYTIKRIDGTDLLLYEKTFGGNVIKQSLKKVNYDMSKHSNDVKGDTSGRGFVNWTSNKIDSLTRTETPISPLKRFMLLRNSAYKNINSFIGDWILDSINNQKTDESKKEVWSFQHGRTGVVTYLNNKEKIPFQWSINSKHKITIIFKSIKPNIKSYDFKLYNGNGIKIFNETNSYFLIKGITGKEAVNRYLKAFYHGNRIKNHNNNA